MKKVKIKIINKIEAQTKIENKIETIKTEKIIEKIDEIITEHIMKEIMGIINLIKANSVQITAEMEETIETTEMAEMETNKADIKTAMENVH